MTKLQNILNKIEDYVVVDYYKKFVGDDHLKIILSRFDKTEFLGEWQQVLTSLSTAALGTGPTFSSVKATYSASETAGLINVKNEAYNEDLVKKQENSRISL